ncbi:MAG: hypothetical protein CSB47_05345 [Proteobacteria bacterium]|nr:MAG: hypothetical protein CSB47_05345 [Pseudomonadota bacterium]
MIDQPNQNITLRVCLEDVGTHNKAVLDFFFAKLGQHIFKVVDTQDEANVLIIDYDYPPARQHYEEAFQVWHKPAIILSIAPVELEDAIWLAKPLTSRALLDAAEQVQSKLSENLPNKPESITASAVASEDQRQHLEQQKQARAAFKKNTPLQRPEIKPAADHSVNIPLVGDVVADQKDAMATEDLSKADEGMVSGFEGTALSAQAPSEPELTPEEQEARWAQLCGSRPDIDPGEDYSSVQVEDSFYLSSLKDAVRLARQCQQGVLLNFPQARIYVLPEIHRVFCAIPLNTPEFEAFINACNVQDGGKMHILSTQEVHELNDMIVQQTSALYDLESFVWTSSLLSAQGVLSRELDPAKAVALKHWPSLTRLEHFPHVMSIAALWSTGPLSAFDVAKSLKIPQRYVFSFYNAASALGLIEQDPDKLIKKQPTTRATEAPRGLFSRLLKRLIGG